MVEFIDKTGSTAGTPLNRVNMMAIQGFEALTTTFENNTIIQTNAAGHTLTTTFNQNGSITQVFEGEYTITKTVTFGDGVITEDLS